MALTYKNPVANVLLTGPEGVSLTSTQGTNFSVSQIGGYQEVYNLENLNLTFVGTGLQQLSANTIPIQINIGNNAGLSWTVLTLNSDNISTGRRRLGMLVYVHENDTTYQYTIPNYDTLWDAVTGLTGSSGVTFNPTSTLVNARSEAGRNFINAWTGSTIEGQNGVDRDNARWRIFYGSQVTITGGTYNSGSTTLELYNSTGGTLSISGFSSDGGTTVTGGTFNHETGELIIDNSDNTSVTISGITDVYTTGGTLNSGNLELLDSTGGTQTISGFTLLEYVTYDDTLNLDTGSRLIDSQPLSGYSMLQYNYVLGDGTNYRSGTFTVTSDRNNISYSEIATQSVGYTKDVVLSATTNGGNIEFRGSFPSDNWQINFVRTAVPVIDLGPIPSLTPTPTPSNTPGPTVTPTASVTPSITPTLTPTPSITATLTPTPSITPTNTITPTITPSSSATVLEYELAVATPYTGSTTVSWVDPYGTPISVSLTQPNVGGYTFCALAGQYTLPSEITLAKSPVPCSSFPTPTPTNTPTSTITPTPSLTPSLTPSITPSVSLSATLTPTPTITPTETLTPTPSVTLTPTPSITPTITPTNSLTPTITPTITPSPSPVILLIITNINPNASINDVKFSGLTESLESGAYPVSNGQTAYSFTHPAVSGSESDVMTYTITGVSGPGLTSVVKKNGVVVDTYSPLSSVLPHIQTVPVSFLATDEIRIELS